MKKLSLLFVASAIAVGSAYACGGEEPAKNPNDVPSASATTPASATASATDVPSATASVTATASTPPPPPEAPPLAIDGIKVTGKGGDGKAVALEVKPDGTVNLGGKLAGTFAKNELKNDKGTTLFSVAPDGKVSIPGAPGVALSFNDKDDLLLDGKPFFAIDDTGVVTVVMGPKTEKPAFKFEKLPPKSKRAAILLIPMISGKSAMPPPPPASASAAPSAKPSAAPSAKPSAAPSAATSAKPK